MDYQGYQFDGKDITSEISRKIQEFILKYGYPPEILEFGQPISLPEGLTLVKRVVSIPNNVMLMGMKEKYEND